MTQHKQTQSIPMVTVVASIAAMARVADVNGIVGAGHEAPQEHESQHGPGACQCRQGCDHHPAARNTHVIRFSAECDFQPSWSSGCYTSAG